MNAQDLYKKLDTDFEIDKLSDDWEGIDLGEHLTEKFKQTYMGLVIDNAEVIEKVYTSVFPSEKVIQEILEKKEKNVLLFTHHPRIWDTKIAGFPFRDISNELLLKMRENNISLYTLHVPLDKNGEYSTTVNFARAIGVEREEDFCEYYGALVGVIGKSKVNTISELAEVVRKVVGHEVKVWNYGSEKIANQKVAVVAGGGNGSEMIEEIVPLGINVYVTGVTNMNPDYQPSIDFHVFAKENKINVIGATHYSSEKFACMAMCRYFQKQDLPCEFIADEPDTDDLG